MQALSPGVRSSAGDGLMAGQGYRIRVSGDRETALAFRRLGLKSRDLERAFHEIANEVVHDAQGMAPKVTGRLAGDIRASSAKTKAAAFVGRVSVPYGGVQEYGWRRRNIAAQPFMRPAADSKADSSAVTIAREMQRIIYSVGLG